MTTTGVERRLLVALVVLLGLVAMVGYFEGRTIVRTISGLVRAANAMAQGRLSERVSVKGRDELALLGRSFNDMAEQLRRIDETKQEMFAAISHELRSPLTRIRMALELLPRDGDSARRIADLERDLADLDRLVEDVLTTARLDATGLPTHLAAVDVRGLLAEVAERVPVRVLMWAGPPLPLFQPSRAKVRAVRDEFDLRRATWARGRKRTMPPWPRNAFMPSKASWP
jgi:signal transduction histidine kinase